MRLALVLVAFMFCRVEVLFAQAEVLPAAEISFDLMHHNFESVVQGELQEYVFSYTNTGDRPLVISNVLTSCGCTASNWSTKPLAPGEEGTVNVAFDTKGKQGQQRKIITVLSNARISRIELTIEAFVLPRRSNF